MGLCAPVTLRDAGGIVTCRDGGVIVRTAGYGGTMMGSAGLAMALSNILRGQRCLADGRRQTGKTGLQALGW